MIAVLLQEIKIYKRAVMSAKRRIYEKITWESIAVAYPIVNRELTKITGHRGMREKRIRHRFRSSFGGTL
jgi:hypothetical protein